MKFSLCMLGLMAIAMVVRFIGWILYITKWLSDSGDRLSFTDAVLIGLAQGWAIAAPMLTISGEIFGAIVAVSVLVLSVPLLIARVKRRSDPKVFISYHYSKQAHVLRLSEVLGLSGLKAQFVPFVREVEHDILLQRVAQALSVAEFVVCFPGDQPSFVESEVLVASTAYKPIIFVVDYPDGRIPNTASKKYPVLTTHGVVETDFATLIELLRYLHGGWREILRLYFLPNAPIDALKQFSNLIALIMLVCFLPLFGLIWFGGLTAFALEYFFPQNYKTSVLLILFVGFFVLVCLYLNVVFFEFVINAFSGIIRRQRAASAAQHAIRLGTCTPTMLRTAFAAASAETTEDAERSDISRAGFLAALWPDQPLAHHESARR